MNDQRPLYVPVILGTTRSGRMSAATATLMVAEIAKRPGVTTDLIDIATISLPVDDAGEAIKDSRFADRMSSADGLVIVTPEYNHGCPGLLKHVLDSCLKEYIHKAVGIVGVSAGGFGGTRVIENLLPTMRELGLVTIFWDVNVSKVHEVFDESGALKDTAILKRIDKFLRELVWMSRTLRYGRERIPVDV
ncbi:MAG: NAD(P)H-dependent oxidoreductase [Acidobacteria bacterium]|nr:NAD(P)H-dependent oxidoreductase [Acidobacteriota bacterium]